MPQFMLSRHIEKAVSFLLSKQDDDGFWRDYNLAPGQSQAWTTACAGLAIIKSIGRCAETDKAAYKLKSVVKPGGWGYNLNTASDADSTSWVIRFLFEAGAIEGIDPGNLLSLYITNSGGVRTFSSVERFGSWGEEHDEVAPLAGIALYLCGEFDLAGQIRNNILKKENWTSFWWNNYSYVCAQNLDFLSISGSIPDIIKEREKLKLNELPDSDSSAFVKAQRLLCETHMNKDSAKDFFNVLLDMQNIDGSWPASAELLVPDQKTAKSLTAYPDNNQVMSTAVSLISLLKYLELTKHPA